MIIRIPFILFLFVMLLQGISFSQEAPFLSKSDAAVAITAGEYCQFLNAVDVTDPDHLYEVKMGPSGSNLIVRTGEVGNYHYQVVAGNEEASMTFMSKLQASYYLNWLQDSSLVLASTIPAMTCDEELQLMNSPFYLVKDSSLTSSQQSSDIEERSFLENTVIGAAGIGMLLMAGREMMTRDVPAERGHPPLISSPNRVQESSSTRLDDQPTMNIVRSGSSPSLKVSEDTLSHPSLEAAPAGSLQGTKVASATSDCKSALCASILSYPQRIEHCRQLLLQAGMDHAQMTKDLAAIDFCFNRAFQSPSCYAQTLFKKAGDYYLQRAQEIATDGVTEKARKLQRAAVEAMNAGKTFEQETRVASPQAKMAFEQAVSYELHASEVIAINGIIEKACNLGGAARAAVDAGRAFEQAEKATSSQAKIAFEEAGKYSLDEAKEQAMKGWTRKAENLRKAAAAALEAGKAFEQAERATSSQAKIAFEEAGGCFLQRAQKVATEGDTERAWNLIEAAAAALEAGRALEQVERTTSPHGDN